MWDIIDDLSISVDYYQIELENTVADITVRTRDEIGVLAQPFHRYLIDIPLKMDGNTVASMPQSCRIAPLIADGRIVGTISVEMIDAAQHEREYYAYLDGNNHLVNEGIVASSSLVEELSSELANEAPSGRDLYSGGAGTPAEALLRAEHGVDPAALRLAAQLDLRGESGTFAFVRPALTLRATLPPLGMDQELDGTIAGSDGANPDGSHYDLYRVQVAAPLAVVVDITARKAAEDALRQQVSFRAAMENSLVTGLRARDLQGRTTYVNPAFCQMVGFSLEELLGRLAVRLEDHAADLAPGRQAEADFHGLRQGLVGGIEEQDDQRSRAES